MEFAQQRVFRLRRSGTVAARARMHGKGLHHAKGKRGAADAAARQAQRGGVQLVELAIELLAGEFGDVGAMDRHGFILQYLFGAECTAGARKNRVAHTPHSSLQSHEHHRKPPIAGRHTTATLGRVR
jgi:hypothetical protein